MHQPPGDLPQLTVREAVPQDARAIIEILNPIITARTLTVFDQVLTEREERVWVRITGEKV